ncbi:MAG: ATP-binding cassette domain-containing protein [Magnetococcales bacterium]|nr:ATP-binding cassette domain-containing protein [Magnetococcales bacterium]NGZ25265.1 ATP-binding cassette domain-containing protein [Magnetococcales bacterium]
MLALDIHKGMTTVAGQRQLALQLTVQPGERLAIYGPSGSGKTTLLRLLAGLERPDGGTITWQGEVWFDHQQKIHLVPRKRRIGYLFQESALFPHLTVGENIAFAQPRPDRQQLQDLLAWTDLTTLAHRFPRHLSGGQQQRVALARALASSPGLLLLDEPFASLDGGLRQQLLETLEKLLNRLSLTTLLVSHDPGEVFRLAHRVVKLDHGQVMAIGTPREVLLAGSAMAGRYLLHGTVLLVESTGVVNTVTVAVGNDLLTALAMPEEVANLRPGQQVKLWLNGGTAMLWPRG